MLQHDDPLPSLAISDATVTEGNSGTRNLTFTVSLSAASGRIVTVQYATADATATAGSDYVARTGTLTFNPGWISQTVSVTVYGDTAVEADEVFLLELSSASNATLGDARG